MIPDCTLTTACFNLNEFHNKSRSLDDCINSMKSLLEVPCYIVIYTDKYCHDKIYQIRKSYGLIHLTKFIIIKFDELTFYKYVDKVKENRKIPFGAAIDERTCSETHILRCSKFNFVLETININPFNTSKFGWIDSSINMNFSKICQNYTNNKLLYILHNISDKFHIQILNANDKKYKLTENITEYYQNYRWVVCGGFFTTSAKIGLPILNRLNEIFIDTTNQGYGHGDEMLYLQVLDEFYDDIHRSYGDYQHILNNFIRPTIAFDYIFHNIINTYLNLGYHKECFECCQTLLYEIENFNVECQANIYMNILFVYYVSSFYYQQNKSLSIIHHIYDVIKNNIKVRYIFNMNKDFFVSQFKYIDKDIENIDKDIDKDENIDKNIENKNSQINKLDSEIKILKDKLDSLTNSNDAGAGLLTDTELLHNQKYTGNWILLVTILGLCYMNKSLINTYMG